MTLCSIPKLNANDDEVNFIEWVVEEGSAVQTGDTICIVETSKASAEIEAEDSGILCHAAQKDQKLKVGSIFGSIASDLESARKELPSLNHEQSQTTISQATPKAIAKAREYGIDLNSIIQSDSYVGSVKERDVIAYFQSQNTTSTDSDSQSLGKHELGAIREIESAHQRLLLSYVECVVDVSAAEAVIAKAKEAGKMLSLMHVILWSISRVLPKFPRLMAIRQGSRVIKREQVALTFVARAPDTLLFTPTIHHAESLELEELAQNCMSLNTAINRGRISNEDLTGGVFTVTHVPTSSSFTATPPSNQSAILAIPGIFLKPQFTENGVIHIPSVNLGLTYDHGLCDATYGAEFLRALERHIASLAHV